MMLLVYLRHDYLNLFAAFKTKLAHQNLSQQLRVRLTSAMLYGRMREESVGIDLLPSS
jgi:hypothetical protein